MGASDSGFDRRTFVAGALLGGVGLRGLLQLRDEIECCRQGDPLCCIRSHNRDVLVAVVEAQLCSIWQGPPADDAQIITEEVLRFVATLDRMAQKGLCAALVFINFHSKRTMGVRLSCLSIEQRKRLLNQGEWHNGAICPPPVRWNDKFLLHSAVSGVTMVCRLIISSRRPAREYAGLTWSKPCQEPENLAHVPPPPYPDLTDEYDLCIIGSGVGGAVVAAKAAEAGKRVLIVEMGDWVGPDAIVERWKEAGKEVVMPARGDMVLMRLYKKSGVQIAGKMPMREDSGRMRLLGARRRMREARGEQTINVIQASVVGGGPYINNAIHLPIEEDYWNEWDAKPAGVDYPTFARRMQRVAERLGVNTIATTHAAGIRSVRFAEGCQKLGLPAEPVPVSILPTATGCGSDNSSDPFGQHTGGLHPYRPNGPNSYMMRALRAPRQAEVAYCMRAVRFELQSLPTGDMIVDRLLVEDRRKVSPGCSGPMFHIRAKQFLLAAGPISSTVLLQDTLNCYGLCSPGLGERFTGNVVMPVYAIYDKQLPIGGNLPEPGITQCFFTRAEKSVVDGRPVLTQPGIENWFHYPGTIEAVWTGWFEAYAEIVRGYNQTAIAGMVVPSKVRPTNRIEPDGRPMLELDDEEFELLLKGIERIGRIFMAAVPPGDGVTISIPTKGLMLDECCRPLRVRTPAQLQAAIEHIRCQGARFLQLATAHPQGGNPLGSVVDPTTFCVRLAGDRQIGNLRVADASVFPSGCGVNPQLTLHTLALYAADALLAAEGNTVTSPTAA